MSHESRATPLTHWVAAQVRHLRKQRGLTADGLAEAVTAHGLRYTRAQVSNLESLRRESVTLDEMYALAAVLGVPVRALLPPLEPPTLGQILGDAIATLEALREGLAE